MANGAFMIFGKFMGTGLVVTWFLMGLVYLFLSEKNRTRRILFIYMPVMMLLLFFNPLFNRLFVWAAEEEIYFRLCWLLPVILVIAYSLVRLLEGMKGKKQFGAALLAVALIVVSGKLVYSSPLYSRAENIYHVPDSVVHICDAIEMPGREVMAVFPEEMLLYVRQYSPLVCMPYGREVIMGVYNPLNEEMEREEADLEALAPLAKEALCHYIILPAEKKILGEPGEYDWELFYETDGYVIYRDISFPLTY